MDFRTEINLPQSSFQITHESELLLMGSCFVQNIGRKLLENKFKAQVNPFGILYNPLSIAQNLEIALSDKIFKIEDLFQHQGLYHSFCHHGDFSDIDAGLSLDKINTSLEKLRHSLPKLDVLIVTFGSSYVYFQEATQSIVANCHKLPAREFNRKRISIEEITSKWTVLVDELKALNPELRIIFTVSPIRHWSDGAHENQLSKSILLLAIDKLIDEKEDIYYFPSYELLLDDLRDYRFYAEDMIHPNSLAVNYIWSKFENIFFNSSTQKTMEEWGKIKKSIDHKPLNPDTEEYQHFLKQTLLKLSDFRDKYPYFDCSIETKMLQNKITKMI